MPDYKYLIIGGGMTADAAVAGIWEVDAEGSIGVVSEEADAPYRRPPLSKGLWKKMKLESIGYKTAEQAELHTGRTIHTLDAGKKRVVAEDGEEFGYDKLLLATGGRPRHLPFDAEGVNYFRTLADYRRLREETERGQRFAVIGGGFIGSEIAAALAMNDKQVTMIFPEAGIGALAYPSDLSEHITTYFQDKGVEVLTETLVTGVEQRGAQFLVRAQGEGQHDERELEVDGVVAGLGLLPNTELAEQAGIEVENGIVVDEYLRTSHPDVFAAGDVAAFTSPALGRRVRVEHEDNARVMGRAAGRNMAGAGEPYDHLPYFYTDFFDLGYQAVGELDARHETISDWSEEPYKRGVVYYVEDERVRGVLLWGVRGQLDAARRLIAEPGPFQPQDLRGRLPEPRG
ncbi:MAG: FAD-dependent oxidoreductase [Chloroflexi bacterium]|nr:FAD-dependent oxidoreductase [Chloroflexota bacterium]